MTRQHIKSITYILLVFIMSCKPKEEGDLIKVSDNLKLAKINDHSYVHISKIFLDNGKQYDSNGFIFLNDDEAYVFDTPANDVASKQLINWLQKEKNTTIKGVVFNHFHRDCNEGMDVFKKYGIPSIASKKTANLMLEKKYNQPDEVFENELILNVGNKKIVNTFFGEAHSKDNIVSFFPEDKILFGGCMIKSLKASKGNLADANVSEWSNTVRKIKKAYPNIEVVIPGHGSYGDQSLLDYTISLFNAEN
ncbi:subclass B1 metallo-beta-lactamase [Aquimarina sp. AD1]|uniref:subclass B1 metallo-beta-lactamase n=1 Tax=Aquimarina sp. (strain AD1) TaxID=1714848 RepID=UPI000E5352C5|nr:subclass B1 metallo-beta-lactamase [Aquimarina sp. AD1]AXT54847.1 subclass B1 metallo-beta-lactamase [Aquimarina sp. AD1]RKN16367.1 subclass B1 metallo-beta-lactamase [Aquimarina sp. AD1]